MPQADVDGLTHQLRRPGRRRAAPADPVPERRPCVLRLPAAGLHRALQLHLGRSARLRRERQAGRARTPPMPYADQLAGFLGAIGVERAHVAGVSLGAAVGMHLAARHPERVRSLSLHSAWDRSDAYLRTVVEMWRDAGRRAADRGRRGHPRHLPVLLHARRCTSSGRSSCRRSTTSCAVARRSHWRPSWPRPRRRSRTTPAAALGHIQAPTLVTFGAHDSSPRRGSPSGSTGPIAGSRADRVRAPLARRACTRTPRRSTGPRSSSCCATASSAPWPGSPFACGRAPAATRSPRATACWWCE